MIRIIYFSDAHYGCQPRNRTDNFNKSILRKLKLILDLARKYQCIVVIGGDLFDTPKTKMIDLIEIILLFKQYQDLKIYCIRGNPGHDGVGSQSSLSLMHHTGLIRVPESENPYIDFGHVRVIFAHHGFDYDSIKSLISPHKCCILSTHRTITTAAVPFEHILIDDFDVPVDCVLLAHYHPYQGIIYRQKDQKLFVGIGALARKKKTTHDINRIPKCAYISVSENFNIKVREIDIPCDQNIWVEKSEFETETEEEYVSMSSQIDAMKTAIDEDIVGMTLTEALEWYEKKVNVSGEIRPEVKKYCLENLK